jgi:hypothetical protein
MAASSSEERVELTRLAWEAYNGGDLREQRCVYMGLHTDFDTALAAAREPRGSK